MSNLIKSSHVYSLEEFKKIEQRMFVEMAELPEASVEVNSPTPAPGPDEETMRLREVIISDAQNYAADRLKEADEQSQQMLATAKSELEGWWEARRQEDQQVIEEASKQGFEQGFDEGYRAAEEKIRAEWTHTLEEASETLQEAYRLREGIIQEGEPFLVELSCAIAERILNKQLSLEQEWVLDLIRSSLQRRREQGVIALCVAPSQLAFVQAAREELLMAVDSQADLQILPDSTVTGYGCVIRSAYGSIDARIDTQLAEIKKELIQLTERGVEDGGTADGYRQA